MRNLIKKILWESSDLDWIKDIPGEEGYGEKYRFFDIYVCFSEYDDDEYDCQDGYSAFIKIPKYEVDILWDGELYEHRYEGMDGFEEIIKWAIDNEQFDREDYSAVQIVREVDKEEYVDVTGDSDLINESSDLDWIKEIEPWSPLNKNILIDFENDPNWNGWESKKSLELANQVISKLESFNYDNLISITNQLRTYGPEFCYIFLEYREFKEDYNFVSWMGCGRDVGGLEDIDEFQRMTATEFLQMV